MATVLVTGATGNLGPVLIRQLEQKGYACRALVLPNDPQRENLARVHPEIVEGHLADYASIDAVVRGVDYVVHMGCIQRDVEPADDPSYYFDINYRSTFLLLWAIVRNNPRLKRFVFTSSCASYSSDNPIYLPIDENHPQRPYSFYGAAKVASEAVIGCFALRHQIPCAIARLTTIMLPQQVIAYNRPEAICAALKTEGQTPGVLMCEQLRGLQNPWTEVEKEIAAIQQKRGDVNFVPMDPHGDPWMWHLTDVRDAASGVIAVMEHPGAVGERFNIAGPTVTWYESAVTQKAKRNIDYALLDLPCSWRYALDTSRARKMLGWAYHYSYDKMYDDAHAYLAGHDIGIPY